MFPRLRHFLCRLIRIKSILNKFIGGDMATLVGPITCSAWKVPCFAQISLAPTATACGANRLQQQEPGRELELTHGQQEHQHYLPEPGGPDELPPLVVYGLRCISALVFAKGFGGPPWEYLGEQGSCCSKMRYSLLLLPVEFELPPKSAHSRVGRSSSETRIAKSLSCAPPCALVGAAAACQRLPLWSSGVKLLH